MGWRAAVSKKDNRKNNKFFHHILVHSNIRNINLIYLRGLDIAKLKEEDMPMV
jgi:hypothetical protein